MSPISNHRVHFDTVADALLEKLPMNWRPPAQRVVWNWNVSGMHCARFRFAWPEIVVSLLGILFLVGLLFIDQTQIGKIILWRV